MKPIVRKFIVKKGETRKMEDVWVFDRRDSRGEILVKAVVEEGANLEMRGKIVIKKGAERTEAFLQQRVLVVGPGARVVAEPELEIETDDVRASHAAAVGKIDEEQLFYLTSRGVSLDEAKGIIIKAFLA